jgi:hypothetical protein
VATACWGVKDEPSLQFALSEATTVIGKKEMKKVILASVVTIFDIAVMLFLFIYRRDLYSPGMSHFTVTVMLAIGLTVLFGSLTRIWYLAMSYVVRERSTSKQHAFGRSTTGWELKTLTASDCNLQR